MAEFVPACKGITETVCHPDMLEFGATYYWQVIAKDSKNQEVALITVYSPPTQPLEK